ncbi:MAG TPA: CapA family protein [Candidatus Paceibacterota bacterium]
MKAAILIVIGLVIAFYAKTELFDRSYLNTPHGSFFKDNRSAEILFVGDMMFDRTIRTKAEATTTGYALPFSCAKEYLSGFDSVVGNLEGPITDYPSTSAGTLPGEPGNTSFTFDPATARALYESNIRLLNLGNNHSSDKGPYGADVTQEYLLAAGVGYFGSPRGNISTTTRIGGFDVAFVNFNQFLGLNDPSKTISAIQGARESSDFVFVYTHWGEEYVPANDFQKETARAFIDAGADMVIGSHPHVIQESEVYNGKHIFYSLGNFIFDQYWNRDVSTGLGVEVFLSPEGISIKEQRFESKRNGTTCLVV